MSLLETSLQNSIDYTQYNTCDDYLNSARTQFDKLTPVRQTFETAATGINPNDHAISIQSSTDYSRGPLTSRGGDQPQIRKGSVDIGGILFHQRNSR